MSIQKLAIISGNGLNILQIKDKTCETFLADNSSIYEALFDFTGRYFCYCSNNGSNLIDILTNEKKVLNLSSRSRKICFSPKGTFVCIFSLNNGNTNDDNVFIYNTKDGQLVHSYKYSNSGTWAPQWSADEKMCIKVLKSEVLVYTDSTFDKFNGKITIKGLEKAAISMSGNDCHIAVYIKGTQGMPNMVKIFQFPNLREPINNRSFFKATDVYLKWSPNGKSLLFLVHTEDTKANYYGENALYFMAAEIGGETALVPMPKDDNYVHSVEWQPISGDSFVATYGNPVAAAVFNRKCQLMHQIDAPNRNVCQFSACGRLLAMIGVGNVRGSLQLWNFPANKLIGEIDLPDINRICWSADDRLLATATVSPGLRVNNGVTIWSLDGDLVADKAACGALIGNPAEIYNVLWQPPAGVISGHEHCVRTGSFYFNANCQKFKEKQAVKVNSAYVPPHLRNRGDGGNRAPQQPNGPVGCATNVQQRPAGQTRNATVRPAMKFTVDTTADSQQSQSANKQRKKKNKSKPVANNNNTSDNTTAGGAL